MNVIHFIDVYGKKNIHVSRFYYGSIKFYRLKLKGNEGMELNCQWNRIENSCSSKYRHVSIAIILLNVTLIFEHDSTR